MRILSAVTTVLSLTAFWLLLVNEIDVGQVVLGMLLAAAVLWMSAPFVPARLPVRRPVAALQLVVVFVYDMVVANLAVARVVLSPGLPIHPHLVRISLDLDDPRAVALLMTMVTLTPGTVPIDLDLEERVLTVHALMEADEATTAAQVKRRYESRIKEIFQC